MPERSRPRATLVLLETACPLYEAVVQPVSVKGEAPLILVTNDDGVHAPGIAALAAAVSDLGQVLVVAPDRNCSGLSHKISLMQPLRTIEIRPGWWQVDGAPADCVYLGVHELLPRRPDLILSGVNSGPNLSFDVHYSGTVGAAMEGTLLGIPSIAISLTHPHRGSFHHAAVFARSLGRWVLDGKLPTNTTLNVNVPGGRPESFQLTFLGHRVFRHSVHRRDDPRGTPYYWIGGDPEAPHDIPGSDCNAVQDGFISVTPLSVDMTQIHALSQHLANMELAGTSRVESVPPPAELAYIPSR